MQGLHCSLYKMLLQQCFFKWIQEEQSILSCSLLTINNANFHQFSGMKLKCEHEINNGKSLYSVADCTQGGGDWGTGGFKTVFHHFSTVITDAE